VLVFFAVIADSGRESLGPTPLCGKGKYYKDEKNRMEIKFQDLQSKQDKHQLQ
jgi:hypothetical protein